MKYRNNQKKNESRGKKRATTKLIKGKVLENRALVRYRDKSDQGPQTMDASSGLLDVLLPRHAAIIIL